MRESLALQPDPEARAVMHLVKRAARMTDGLYLTALRHFGATLRGFGEPDRDAPMPSVRGTYAAHLAGKPYRASCGHGCLIPHDTPAARCEHGQVAWARRYGVTP